MILCNVLDTTTPCERCGFRHPGFPNRRRCRTLAELRQDQDSFGHSATASAGHAHDAQGCLPGAALKAILAGWPFYIVAGQDCKCTSRAAYMDQMGCDWCEANIDEIVGWLRESAAERGLPFLDVAGRVLIRRAIANARRKEQARAKEAQAEGRAAG